MFAHFVELLAVLMKWLIVSDVHTVHVCVTILALDTNLFFIL